MKLKGKLLSDAEKWYERGWRPTAAFIYLAICLFDFVLMPIVYEISNDRVTPSQAIVESLQFKDSASQIQALQTLTSKRSWTPITLGGSGLFHLAFLTILGAASYTRGQEKIERLRQIGQLGDNDDDDNNNNQDPPPNPPGPGK